MLCRNFDLLKSNQYFDLCHQAPGIFLYVLKLVYRATKPPHFSMIKFLARTPFRQILKLPFSPVFTRLSHEFCMYFQTTYYRPVAGVRTCPPEALPRGQTGPPNPRLPTQQRQRRLRPDTSSGNAIRSWNVSQNFWRKPGSSEGNEIHHSGVSSIR